jgi:hypothetical protein
MFYKDLIINRFGVLIYRYHCFVRPQILRSFPETVSESIETWLLIGKQNNNIVPKS